MPWGPLSKQVPGVEVRALQASSQEIQMVPIQSLPLWSTLGLSVSSQLIGINKQGCPCDLDVLGHQPAARPQHAAQGGQRHREAEELACGHTASMRGEALAPGCVAAPSLSTRGNTQGSSLWGLSHPKLRPWGNLPGLPFVGLKGADPTARGSSVPVSPPSPGRRWAAGGAGTLPGQ